MDEKVIAVYNTDQKKLVAIIRGATLVSRYIFGKYDVNRQTCVTRIYNAIKLKRVLRKNSIGFNVAVRNANKQQLEMIGSEEYLIVDETTAARITFDMLIRFHDTAASLTKRAVKKNTGIPN